MRIIGILLIACIVVLTIIGCFPSGEFHSLVDITLSNQSSYNVNFFTRRIGDREEMSDTDHGIVLSGTSNSFKRSSGYTYSMYCKDKNEIHNWGPKEVYIDFDQDYEWIIEDPPRGNITINNNSGYNINIHISDIDKGNINSGEFTVYSEEIGNYNLKARIENGSYTGYCWHNSIELTEAGYIWNLEINTELYPSENCYVWNFEEIYNDHLGKIECNIVLGEIFYSPNKKYDDFSLHTKSEELIIQSDFIHATIGLSQSMGSWIYISDWNDNLQGFAIFEITNKYAPLNLIQYRLKKEDLDYKAVIDVRKNSTPSNLKGEYIFNVNKWNYVAFSYDADTNLLWLVCNDSITSYEPEGSWGEGTLCARYFSHTTNVNSYLDETIWLPNQFIAPQVFVDHYNHNVPWGAEYIP